MQNHNANYQLHEWIPYDSIAGTAPYGMRKPQVKRQLKFWQCLIFFVVLMLVWILTNGWTYLLTGSLKFDSFMMEFEFLAAAVLFAWLMKADLREVFPFRKPIASAVLGLLVLVAACYLVANTASVLELYFAPEALERINEGMEGEASFSLPAQLFLTAFMPAVCEEALHRGILFSGMRTSFRKRWQIILTGGVLFGVFHLYPVRWWIPGIIGAIMAWVLLETDNMFYTCLLHFLYNSLLVIVSYFAADASASAVSYTVSAQTVGVSLIFYGIPIPILIYTGCWLIRRAGAWNKPAFIEEGMEERRLLQILLPTGLLLLAGIVFLLIR